VHSVIADPAGSSAWSFGGSILTFAFPMILFIVVACALYIAYTKPELVPGHRNPAAQRPVSYTAVPGEPAAGGKASPAAGGKASPAAAGGKASSAVPPGKQEPEGGE
jgi:hypothetical protein